MSEVSSENLRWGLLTRCWLKVDKIESFHGDDSNSTCECIRLELNEEWLLGAWKSKLNEQIIFNWNINERVWNGTRAGIFLPETNMWRKHVNIHVNKISVVDLSQEVDRFTIQSTFDNPFDNKELVVNLNVNFTNPDVDIRSIQIQPARRDLHYFWQCVLYLSLIFQTRRISSNNYLKLYS